MKDTRYSQQDTNKRQSPRARAKGNYALTNLLNLKVPSILFFGSLFLPNFALAQGLGGSFRDIVGSIIKILSNTIVPMLTAIAFLVVLYNFVMFIAKSDNETERSYFKKYTLWSLTAFFCLLAVFAIVKMAHTSIFGGSNIAVPQFQTGR